MAPETRSSSPSRGGDGLEVHPVGPVLGLVVGAVGGEAVGVDEGAVEDGMAATGSVGPAQAGSQWWRLSAEQVDRLVHAAGGGGAGDAEAGRGLLVGVALVEVGEREQCLSARVEDPPAGSDRLAVGTDEPGGEAQGVTRKR